MVVYWIGKGKVYIPLHPQSAILNFNLLPGRATLFEEGEIKMADTGYEKKVGNPVRKIRVNFLFYFQADVMGLYGRLYCLAQFIEADIRGKFIAIGCNFYARYILFGQL
jgi:hypothetical protein